MFRGKVALITGAAQGLGKAFTEALLNRGANACIADTNIDKGESTVKALQKEFGKDRALFVVCDVSKKDHLEEAFKRTHEVFGGLDIMVNNAGIADERNWEKMMEVNLMAVMRGSYQATEYMRTDKGGRGGIILNVASMGGLIVLPTFPAYNTSKAGVIGFTRNWAETLKKLKIGVKCTCLCPEFTKTDMIKFKPDNVFFPDLAKKILENSGIMEPSEVSNAFLQLLENEKNNGAVMVVSKQGGVKYKYMERDSKL